MYAALRPLFNTGVAVAGAGAVALAPVVVTPPALSALDRAVANSVMQDVALTAVDVNTDISAALNALGNSVLLGVAVSLDLDPAVQAALEAAIETGSTAFFDNLAAVGGAIVDAVTGAFDTNPIEALAYLATLPVNLLTGAAGGLFDGLAGVLDALPGLPDLPGLPGLEDVAGLLAAPIQFILNSLEAGNATLANLLSTGVTGFTDLITGGLETGTALLTGGLVAGAGLVGGLFTGAAGVLTAGAASLAAALAPLAALPVVGVPVAALGDLLGGFALAGATVLNGVGTAIPTGATVIRNLITSTVGALGTAIGGGADLLAAGVTGLSLATYQTLSGLANGIGEFVPGVVPPPAPPAPVAAANAERSALAASVATGDVASPPSLKRNSLTLQADPAAGAATTAETVTSGVVKDQIDATDPGPARGAAVSDAASDGAAGGSASNTNPANENKPDNTGKPETTGKPEATGKPDKAPGAAASANTKSQAGRGAAGSKGGRA